MNWNRVMVWVLLCSIPAEAPALTRYVNAGGTTPASPYTSWATAATNIQSAINVSQTGDVVLVTNGVYKYGGANFDGSNRVYVTVAGMTVRSVNGPLVTSIEGYQNPGGVGGVGAARCVYLTSSTTLSGFTLTNGATYSSSSGGAIKCQTVATALVTNCIIIGGRSIYGGGSAYGTLVNCLFLKNSAMSGAGAYNSTLIGCTLSNNIGYFGGAAHSCIVSNCWLVDNYATNYGGGAYACTLSNCVLVDNGVGNWGGGAYTSKVYNCVFYHNYASSGGGVHSCTVFNSVFDLTNHAMTYGAAAYGSVLTGCALKRNWASGGGGGSAYGVLDHCYLFYNRAGDPPYTGPGGASYSDTRLNNCFLIGNLGGQGSGAYGSALMNCTIAENFTGFGGGSGTYGCQATNCIIYFNRPADDAGSFLDHCCISNGTHAAGSTYFVTDPLLIDFLHLSSNSPCIDAGNNTVVAGSTDFDGRSRVINGAVDIGATEFQGAAREPFIAWLYQYQLPDDGSVDTADSDGDGLNNWQEWSAQTDPTNATSVLQMSSAIGTPAGVTVSWESVTNVVYYLDRSSDLAGQPCFTTVQSNIVGQTETTSFTDTTASGPGPFFYRVGVQQ